MKRFVLALAALLPLSAFASAQSMRTVQTEHRAQSGQYVSIDDVAPDAAKVAARIGEETGEPVAYPSMLPAPPDTLHAYGEAHGKIGASTFYLDSQPGCKGAHYCNVGALTVQRDQAPADLRNMKGTDITVKVTLANGQDAYFTPGHAMGDFWPAQIQWTRGASLYTLVWNGAFPDGEQQTMMRLADSVR